MTDTKSSLTDEKRREYARRVLLSRMRVLNTHPFFGMLLMQMDFSINEDIETAATDGERIMFSPSFLDSLSDSEVDFILMHETLHAALQHCTRGTDYDQYIFNIACDIVVNSNILKANGMNKDSITLKRFGESMHLTPDGKEGYEFTAEQVYAMLLDKAKKQGGAKGGAQGKGSATGSGSGSGSGDGDEDKDGESGGSGKGKGAKGGKNQGAGGGHSKGALGDTWDNHERWGTSKDELLQDKLVSRVANAEAAIRIMDPTKSRGLVPLAVERYLDELKNPRCDWRSILNEFIDTEICDYSFSPPDRRFDGTGFYLPDYNDTEERVENILFMIDTSGSMSDALITDCFSEIKGAIDMFDGKLAGLLGFFDGVVVPPVPFDSVESLKAIRPKGGGGTRFDIIFEYVKKKMSDNPPKSIIILTDGYAPFPDERLADNIPVLWVIAYDKEVKPTFGKTVYIE
ncbi:MAG: hypothetical protein J6L90_01215 [Clostridia bacterium]|nr:hypothetical protein [Clostridia bacterium]